MSMLTDPEMKEVVDEFCQESLSLSSELEDILDDLEEKPQDSQSLEKFGQVIDRIMGTAKSLGAEKVGTLCELGKTIGYKSSQEKFDPALNEIIIAVLFDNVDILKKLTLQIQQGKGESLEEMNIEAFVSRLKWLSEKFEHIDRASCEIDEDDSDDDLDQASIDDLLAELGL